MPKTMPTSTNLATQPSSADLYARDEHEWIAVQISALTDGNLNCLDRASLVEYLTEMTIRDRRELQSRLIVLLHHLLTVRLQPERSTRNWAMTIIEQQSEIRSFIENIPSLGRQAGTIAAAAYPDAVRRAARETGLPASRFPTASPWTVAAALVFEPPESAAKSNPHS